MSSGTPVSLRFVLTTLLEFIDKLDARCVSSTLDKIDLSDDGFAESVSTLESYIDRIDNDLRSEVSRVTALVKQLNDYTTCHDGDVDEAATMLTKYADLLRDLGAGDS